MKNSWNGKPYYSLNSYLKETYGQKLYKLSLDGEKLLKHWYKKSKKMVIILLISKHLQTPMPQ